MIWGKMIPECELLVRFWDRVGFPERSERAGESITIQQTLDRTVSWIEGRGGSFGANNNDDP